MARNIIFVLIYHRHKLFRPDDSILYGYCSVNLKSHKRLSYNVLIYRITDEGFKI
jgi:hypothetical protein